MGHFFSRINRVTPRNVDGMRVVSVQELEAVDANTLRSNAESCEADYAKKMWKGKKCTHGSRCKCEVLTYMENCTATVSSHQNPFFGAFLAAYNTHQDVLLAPDDVWLLVCLQFSKYVNKNAEAMRSKLVSHDGEKKLTVVTPNETSESQWEEFLTLMKDEIARNTKDDVVGLLQCDFSTTGLVERLISTTAVMDSFKQYFSYGRCIPWCGIRNVCFLGTLEDWMSLREKVHRLLKYDIDGTWKSYICGVRSVLERFIATYQGQVDVTWWNQVMNLEQGRLGSGSTTYVSGWILDLFGLTEKCDISDIPSYSISVPVKIANMATRQLKTVHLIGGFGGVHEVEVLGRKAYRTQSSFLVLHDPTSEEDREAALEHFYKEQK